MPLLDAYEGLATYASPGAITPAQAAAMALAEGTFNPAVDIPMGNWLGTSVATQKAILQATTQMPGYSESLGVIPPPQIGAAPVAGLITGAVAAKAATSVLPRLLAALGIGGIGLDAVTEGGLIDLPGGGDVLPGPGVFRVPWANGGPPDQTDPVAYTWNTGTAKFYRLQSGKIAVQRKNGLWKVYRPKKHIVISTNPRMSAISKLERTHKRVIRDLARSSVDLVLKSSRSSRRK